MNAKVDRRDGLAVVGVFLGLLAIVGVVFSVGLGVRALDDDGGGTSVAAGAEVPVELSEFAITPTMVSAPVGSTLKVTNTGSAPHNLSIKDTDLITPDIEGGASATLDISKLPVGEHTIICAIPGHESSGMTGMLHIVEGGVAAPAGGEGGSAEMATMTPERMDELMAARTHAFPEATKGTGAQEMEPTVLADGTKEFVLTASVFDWEVEKGKIVEAWGYNEQVPGPTIRVGLGEKVRIVLNNELPESTALHSHGFTLPNGMDGVPDITQEPIKSGDSFVYEFTTKEAMVGMYHSHHNAAKQVTNGLLGAFYSGEMPIPDDIPEPTVDVPMVLNDAGTIGYSLNGKSFPATAPIVAKVGDWVKVDYMNEGLQVHPMHLHGMPQLLIAKDGYPHEPRYEDTVLVAPGERVSVLVHATEPGTWAWHCHILTHAEREDGMFGMVTAMVVS